MFKDFITIKVLDMPEETVIIVGFCLVIKHDGVEKKQYFREATSVRYDYYPDLEKLDEKILMHIANKVKIILRSLQNVIDTKIAMIPDYETGYCQRTPFTEWRLEKLF